MLIVTVNAHGLHGEEFTKSSVKAYYLDKTMVEMLHGGLIWLQTVRKAVNLSHILLLYGKGQMEELIRADMWLLSKKLKMV